MKTERRVIRFSSPTFCLAPSSVLFWWGGVGGRAVYNVCSLIHFDKLNYRGLVAPSKWLH